ncbi:anti-phage dCTP deaminase [Colwellia psychrerythraea]|uniref:CMP/dCMP deaminase zinc-binding protein n=1 Tax=Colwellia psychrerythraea TaxID=28229 RepID=A0A099KJ32_COLPS|nr:anti-phage dCTP deaminase [Colwellia psychrerythraea]KGJ90416.1 CMP/dCMP deaminase zinc-binding protein [Colwellia psychrerythraea]
MSEGSNTVIIGLVAPIGVDLDLVNESIEIAVKHYGYEHKVIQLANLDKAINGEKELTSDTRQDLDYKNIEMGKLRKKSTGKLPDNLTSSSVYASLLVNFLKGNKKNKKVYIIDSLKRPEEVELLREIYGESFFLIGVTSSYEDRLLFKTKELQSEPNGEELARTLVDSDDEKNQDTRSEYDNKTHKAFLVSDLFIYLDPKNPETLLPSIERFIDIIFGAENITPTPEEHNMFLAYMSSLKSADLSRQVGSAIINSDNDIIAMGANDVPKFEGGSYWPDEPYQAFVKDGFEYSNFKDKRDYILGIDKNAEEKSNIIQSIVDSIKEKVKIENEAELINAIENSKLSDITEYGRAVHAEMSAIMSAAKNGIAVKNSIMFCTTYPCHNCAKHIVASGIVKVFYIEPYSKSKAIDSHSDSIEEQTEDSQKVNDKVLFTAFSGIAPRLYQDFFSMKLGDGKALKRKEYDGSAIYLSRVSSAPLRISIDKDIIELKETRYLAEINFVELSKDFNTASVDKGERVTSEVKFWRENEEYGCIKNPDEYENDYFFNTSNLADDSILDKLGKGLAVSFNIKDGTKKGVKFADVIEVLQE